ncbi:hypothetical protein AVEN_7326-1 [Araneus ventricosus]|uniref:Uncharacterized protein n=1 Tax=Araneus ventricosus TaxID=182803 RepID=A0A4Y2BQW7_ARAVE|nr:hypothetical protein AVEN_7326-1 [Araneus ventricosus]
MILFQTLRSQYSNLDQCSSHFIPMTSRAADPKSEVAFSSGQGQGHARAADESRMPSDTLGCHFWLPSALSHHSQRNVPENTSTV